MRLAILILLTIVIISDVKALAVISDYLPGKTLELLEDTSTIYNIKLQNPSQYEYKVKVTYDDTLMKAINFKEEYTLPPKSNTKVEFNVTAPKYVKNKDIFELSLTVHQLTGAGGGVGFLPKISKQFKLKVVEDPNAFYINYWYLGYGIVLLIIIFFLLRKKESK